MAKTLKEIFGLREMAVNVPDKDAPALRNLIKQAAAAGMLPSDAIAWMGRDPAGTPSAGVPTSEPQASAQPKASKAKGKKQDPKSPVTPRAPIPVSADAQAAINKSSSAWDKLGGAGFTPPGEEPAAPAPAAPQKPAPDPAYGDISFDNQQWDFDKDGNAKAGDRTPNWQDNTMSSPAAPASANVDLTKGKKPGMLSRVFGQKPKAPANEPDAIEPKQGMLKKVFGGKPKVKPNAADNDPYTLQKGPAKDDEPVNQASVANAARKGRDWADQDVEPDADPQVDGSVEDPFGDLKNLAKTYTPAGGAAAAKDMDWDLSKSPPSQPITTPAPQPSKDTGPSMRGANAQPKKSSLAKVMGQDTPAAPPTPERPPNPTRRKIDLRPKAKQGK